MSAALVADIGGTNVRFALLDHGAKVIRDLTSFPCANFASITDAVEYYLQGQTIDRAAFAVAGPISGDDAHLTNSSWSFSIDAAKHRLALSRLVVVNDFAATALAVPFLETNDLLPIGGDAVGRNSAPIGVIGPGTGLGVSALIPLPNGGYMALEAEGGHVTMPAANDREAEVLAYLRQEHGHVSAERVVSGPGLVNVYRTLRQLSGRTLPDLSPDQIASLAITKECPVCTEALDLFFAMLGTVAGNLALTVGAKGGVVLAGGILPRLQDALITSRFRTQFEAKGRFHPWLSSIPTSLILHPDPAIIGLVGLV